MKAQDTSELFFQDVKVPEGNLLGSKGARLFQLMQELPQERLLVGVTALAACEAAFQWTLDYVKNGRHSETDSGIPEYSLQAGRVEGGNHGRRIFVDRCLELHLQKNWTFLLRRC